MSHSSEMRPAAEPQADAKTQTSEETDPVEKTQAMSFKDLGLAEPLLRAIRDEGYEEPTPIQVMAVPHLLKGRALMGRAQTGPGKPAAFALPILQQLKPDKGTQCLILAPTRELAAQVAGEILQFARFTGHSVMAVYGGTAVRPQVQRLRKAPAIVGGPPGRVQDLMPRKAEERQQLDGSHRRVLPNSRQHKAAVVGSAAQVDPLLGQATRHRVGAATGRWEDAVHHVIEECHSDLSTNSSIATT